MRRPRAYCDARVTPRRLIEPARLAGTAVLRTQSDDRLVDLVRDGNDRAFEAIVHRYRAPLLRYCRRFLSAARADDAVQQTFVNAVAAIRAGDAEINLRPWLYRIAHNAALNVLRQPGADHEEISEQIDGVETPPQALERGERFRTVVAAVRDLPDRQRDALVLQALEGRSYDEIAIELGVTGGAVRQLLNRARTTLREGVTALTPPALVTRLGGALDAPVADRVAQVVAGAGGAAALGKIAAVVAATTAVVGGAADGILSHDAAHHAAAAAGNRPAEVRARPAASPAVNASLRPVARVKPQHRAAARTIGTHRLAEPRHLRHDQPAPEGTGDDHGGSRGDDGGSHHGGGGGSGDSNSATTVTDDHSGSGGRGSDDGLSSGSSDSSGSGDTTSTTPLTDDSSGSTNSGPGGGDARLSSGSDDATSDGGTSSGSH